MPSVVAGAALSAVFAGSTIAGGILTVGFSLTTFATSLVLGGLSYALTPKPKKAPQAKPGVPTSTVAVRQPDMTRSHAYGHIRTVKGYAHMEVTGVNNKLHLFVILCEGELRAINEVWMDDYAIPNDWLDADGNVTQGRYAGKLQIRKHLGAANQAADPVAIANLTSWTIDHRGQGIAYLYLILTKDQDVYPNGVPNISAIVEGPSLFDSREDDLVWTQNIAVYSHNFIQDTDYGFAAFSEDIDQTNIAAQANICDEIVDTNEPSDAVAVTAIDTGTDIITLEGTLNKFQFADRVQVTSTGTLPSGISALTNYYVIPYQVKDTPRILLATSLDNALAKINIDITTAGTGTITVTKNGEPRYHGAGVHDTETDLSEGLNNIVSSMAGRAVCIGGFWSLLAGAWRTPTLTLTPSDMRSALSFKNALSMSDSYNVIKGLFVSPLNSYQSTDYPAARYQQFIDDDNGLESPKELNLSYTTRPTAAQRIAKIELFRGRQDITVNCDFSGIGFQVQPGDNIMLTVDWLGWDQKYFEITDFSFDINQSGMVTRMTLRETAQEIFDWDDGEAISFDPAPNTNLPDPFTVSVPTGVGYNSRAVDTAGGDSVYTLVLTWDPHPDSFVTEDGRFELQFKLSNDTDWRPSFFVDGKMTQSDLLTNSVNVEYDLRIRAVNRLGRRSNWVTILEAVVGTSGGVTIMEDYGLVSDAVGLSLDYGNVYDAPGATVDNGFVV